jgi:hypothetical protein
MNSILTDSVWQRKGISVLWDSKMLTQLNSKSQVISLRHFFLFYENGWPETVMPFINERQLLVAGLDAALDALPAEEAEHWVKSEVYQKIYDFQNFAEGQYALTFWMTDQNRWREQFSENKYYWLCSGKEKDKQIDLGTGIWNGAQKSVRQIETDSRWIGLYLDRIS